jgi:drug/metabolite transporter (DMT)-like permease
LIIFAPVYLLMMEPNMMAASTVDIGLQAFMQGGISAVAALYFYGQAIRRLGASRAAAITSLTPVAISVLGLLLLGETPSTVAWIGVGLVSVGVAFASGGLYRPNSG